jgi:hypothetical protein
LSASSRQVGTPVVHALIPFMHAACGFVVQAWPAVHRVHWPFALQTWFAPQPLPAGFEAPSTQVCAPVAHDVTPVLHAFALVLQGWPALHAVQAPLPSHTMPTPQLVPAAVFAPSVQVVAVPLHVVLPCLHAVGLPVQLWLATQAPQKPLPSHIWLPPQVAVIGLGMPSTQTDAPVVHDVTPLRQIDGFVVHAVPAVHATQVPLPLHT